MGEMMVFFLQILIFENIKDRGLVTHFFANRVEDIDPGYSEAVVKLTSVFQTIHSPHRGAKAGEEIPVAEFICPIQSGLYS